MMTANPAYTTPSPTLAAMTAAVDDLEAKATAALNGGRVQTAAKRAARVNLLALGRQLSNYVESHCSGSVETLLSSSFDAQRAASPAQLPGTPGNPRFENGQNSGTMVLNYDSDGTGNTRNYSVQYAENVEGPWVDHGIFTATKVKIAGLTAGKVYYGRARAHGAAGSSDWSVPTSKMAV